MTVKLDSPALGTIEVVLTPDHVKSLRTTARNAALEVFERTIPGDEHESNAVADAAFDAALKLLGEWAKQTEEGCCPTCDGSGFAGQEPCADCLATGHAHSPFSPCPKAVTAKDEGWHSTFRRAQAMQDEANQLKHLALYEMRCPLIVESTGGLKRRCSLNVRHQGDCDPNGSDTE